MKKSTAILIGLASGTLSCPLEAATVNLTTTLEPSAGGFLADDNGDGVFDRALTSTAFTVGGGVGPWAAEYQGSYEFDLASLGQNLQIVSATLYLTRTGFMGSVSTTPHILGEVGLYIADGTFSLIDAYAGARIATFQVWNHNLQSPPYPNSAFDVTSALESLYEGGDRIAGFNFRSSSLPASGSVDNGFNSPTLRIEYNVVPEPSTLCLMVFGYSILFVRKRF